MAPNDHLLARFNASEETHNLAGRLLPIAQMKTRPGAGHAVGEHTVGLPAVCMLLASERLKNGEFTEKIQTSSSLKMKDFRRVYQIVKAALEEEEQSSLTTYKQLYTKYKLQFEDYFDHFITETENELILLGHNSHTTLFRCAVFFWVWTAIMPKALPTTELFARNHELSFKLLVNLLGVLNSSFAELRKEIQADVRSKKSGLVGLASPAKTTNPVPGPRQSPRKQVALRELPSNDGKNNLQPQEAVQDSEPESPTKRLTRSHTVVALSPTKATPTRTGSERFPTKVPQLPPPARLVWKKAPLRELPSKDSPKKRISHDTEDQMDADELPETPTKKRRIETKAISPTPQPVASSSRPPRKNPGNFPSTILFPTPTAPSPTKRIPPPTLSNPLDLLASSDESEPEDMGPPRRFRPVYLEQRQWAACDPRLAKTWRKADKRMEVFLDSRQPSRPSKKR